MGADVLYRENEKKLSAPSGIAQLRNSIALAEDSPDNMSLDDFVFSNMASPSDMSPPDSRDNVQSNAAAIPIKMRKEAVPAFAPQSVPVQQHQDEFSYVQRHVRKTSIDERRVRIFFLTVLLLYRSNSHLGSQETCRLLSSRTSNWNYHSEPFRARCGSQRILT